MSNPLPLKYIFSGHESFQCRQFWLKKGIDFISSNLEFSSENAVVVLGVGKNMVSSIRYWLRAFDLSDNFDIPTQLGLRLLSNEGYDPFLEDDGSLWLLHYALVKKSYASIYSVIFNDYRKERIEFNRSSFLSFMKRKAELIPTLNFNVKTLSEDFDVFRKMYLPSSTDKVSDDGYSVLLSDLRMVNKIEKLIENNKEEFYKIENNARRNLPLEIFIYAILENQNFGSLVSVSSIEHDFNSPGAIFCLSRIDIINYLREAQAKYSWILFIDHAGIQQVQFKDKPEAFVILDLYYDQK